MTTSQPPKSFVPVRQVEADAEGSNRLVPLIDGGGTPIWQAGDGNPIYWEITSVGWSHGGAANRKDNGDIKGRVYLSDARVLVVSDRYAKGSRYRSYGTAVISSAVATKVSEKRAQHAAAGTFLTGLMRIPWLTSIVFATAEHKKALRGEIRLVGEHVTAFGDPESALLIFRLANPADTVPCVEAIIERVKRDRLAWERTNDAQRAALEKIPAPSTVKAAEGNLSSIAFPGGWQISFATCAYGANSNLSFPTENES